MLLQLENHERSAHPPQAIELTPCLIEGQVVAESTAAQISSAADKAGRYVQFGPTVINRQCRRTG